MSGDEVDFWALIATWAAVLVAFWSVWNQIRATRALTRQQLFLQMYSQWESDTMQEKRSRLASELLNEPTEFDFDDSALVFLEVLCDLVRAKNIDLDLVWNAFGVEIPSYWAASEKCIRKLREDESDRSLFMNIEAVSVQINKVNSRRRETVDTKIGVEPESIKRFLSWEVRRGRIQATAA